MGIHVSYKGADGGARSFSVKGAGDLLSRISQNRAELSQVPALNLVSNVPPLQKMSGGGGFAAASGSTRKVRPSASIDVKSDKSVVLKGDAAITPNASKKKMGMFLRQVGGIGSWRGWGGLDDIDAPAMGKVIGVTDSTSAVADQEIRQLGNVGPFGQMYVARIVAVPMKVKEDASAPDADAKEAVGLYAMYRVSHKTDGGRTFGVDGEVPVFIGYLGGAGGEALELDGVSVDLRDGDDTHDDGKVQIKDWDHADGSRPASAQTVAFDLAGSQAATGDQFVVRKADGTLAYKNAGALSGGSDSNVVITPVANGGATIDVYYI